MEFIRNLGFLRGMLRGKKKGGHPYHPYAAAQFPPGFPPQDPAMMAQQNNSPAYGQFGCGEDATDLAFIEGGVWLGSFQATAPQTLQCRGIANVLNCAVELLYEERDRWVELENASISVMHVHWEDLPSQRICPSPELEAAMAWVDRIRAAGQQVLINCRMGISRSSSMVIAYLIHRMGHSFDSALQLVRQKRPIANPNPGFVQQLRQSRANSGPGPMMENMNMNMNVNMGMGGGMNMMTPGGPVMNGAAAWGNPMGMGAMPAPQHVPAAAGGQQQPQQRSGSPGMAPAGGEVTVTAARPMGSNTVPAAAASVVKQKGGGSSPSPSPQPSVIRLSPGSAPNTFTLSLPGNPAGPAPYFSPVQIAIDPAASVTRNMMNMLDPASSVTRNLQQQLAQFAPQGMSQPQGSSMMMLQLVPQSQYAPQW